MEEVIRKLNHNLRNKAPDYEIKYYNNEYSKGQLFQFRKSTSPGSIKYVYYQTKDEKEAVKEYKRIVGGE